MNGLSLFCLLGAERAPRPCHKGNIHVWFPSPKSSLPRSAPCCLWDPQMRQRMVPPQTQGRKGPHWWQGHS